MILIITLLCIFLFNQSKELKLSDFEKIAIYGYLEDYLSLDKLYMLSGNSSYDDLHYTQSKIKEVLDSYYEQNHSEIIPTNVITSELEEKYGISTDTLDFHGILVSNYEYLPEDNSFKRVEGANSGLADSENQVQAIANSNDKVSVKSIEKISNDSYLVNFDIISSSDLENQISQSGNVTIKVANNSYELTSCNIND